jgi:HSP20 family protein
VEITFGDGLLTIQGERRAASDTEGERVHRSERRYGAFRRSITLPSHVQAGKIEATAQDGVLQILIPKAMDVQAKRIPVRAGQPRAAVTPGGTANGS